MIRALAVAALCLFTGCVAQVRGTRVQKPFTVAPLGTPWPVTALAVGAPPITWKVLAGGLRG